MLTGSRQPVDLAQPGLQAPTRSCMRDSSGVRRRVSGAARVLPVCLSTPPRLAPPSQNLSPSAPLNHIERDDSRNDRCRHRSGDCAEGRDTRMLLERPGVCVEMVRRALEVVSATRFKSSCRASEMLLSVPASKRAALLAPETSFHTSTPARTREVPPATPFSSHTAPRMGLPDLTSTPAYHPMRLGVSARPEERAREVQLEALDEDYITAAQSFMENKEYARAIHWLKDCKSSKAKFLSVYAQFLVILLILVQRQTFDDG